MCGFAGIIQTNAAAEMDRLQTATNALKHRGPAAQQFYTDANGKAVLGHQRLCIIDLSTAAAQPMHYNNRYTIVYNGELYNYIELRQQLQGKGFSFRSSSDTEVVVAAYAFWGKECLTKFDGAFSFAVWDGKEEELFAARDRFGEKPFYYCYEEGRLFFASEMKSFWAAGVEKKISASMLYNFLTIGYTADPFHPSHTFYEGIYKLPPAHSLTYTLAKGELTIEQYWNLTIGENNTIKESEAIDQCRHLLEESVRLRLRSDVAIGTSLSGGLDSSTIVALCGGIATDQYTHKCFTAVFPGFEKNEEHHAAQVAAAFNLEHIRVAIDESSLTERMQKVSFHVEEPFASGSALLQYEVYRTAKEQGVTVLLDGQGADEVFGGYHKYYKWQWQNLYAQRRLKSSGELAAARALGVTEPFGVKQKTAALFPQFTAALQTARRRRNAYQQTDLNREFAFSNKEAFAYLLPAQLTLNGALYADTVQYGLEELLKLADRNSMAHAVEVRLPYLSHHLVNFLFTLPPHFKIHQGWTKWLLRKTAETLLPKEIVWRRDKVGFEPPQVAWMQRTDVQAAIKGGKEKLVKEGILDKSVLAKKIQPHEAHAAANKDWKYWSASLLFP